MILDGPALDFGFLPVGILGLLLLIIFLVLIGATRRASGEWQGHRILVLYLLVVMFVTLFTATGAVFQAGSALVRAAVDPLPPEALLGPWWVVETDAGVGGVGGFGVAPPGAGELTEPPLPRPEFISLLPSERSAADVIEALILGAFAAGAFAFHGRVLGGLLARDEKNG